MDPVSRSTDEWFNEIEDKRDSPLLLRDGTECSMLRNELQYLVEREKKAPATAEECRKLERNLVGLAFSGGGIRSATFGLGVLEALKDLGLGKQFHFLSTVSGGGYLGAWLSANCARAAGTPSSNSVGGGSKDWLSPDAQWGGSIGHLRRYSKYLSPDFGFASADIWSMLTIWIRNALLIQFTIILAIAALLLVPRLLMPPFNEWYYLGHLRWITVGLYLVAVVGIAANERRLLAAESDWMLELKYWRQGLVLSIAALLTAWFYGHRVGFEPFSNKPIDITTTVLIAMLLMFATYCLIVVAVKILNYIAEQRKVAKPPRGSLQATISASDFDAFASFA